MDKSWRRGWPVAVGLLLAAAGPGHLAWACVPQPKLVSVLPSSSGPPGTKVNVDGIGFDSERTEVRWNSRDGELLGVTGGPDFSVEITIPRVPDGLYALIVLSRDPAGGIGNTARAAFQVVGSSDPPVTTPRTATTSATAPPPASSGSSLDLPVAGGLVVVGGVAGGVAATLLQRRRRHGADA